MLIRNKNFIRFTPFLNDALNSKTQKLIVQTLESSAFKLKIILVERHGVAPHTPGLHFLFARFPGGIFYITYVKVKE